MEISIQREVCGRCDAHRSGRTNDGRRPGSSSFADDQAEVGTTSVGDFASGLPVALEAGAGFRRVEQAIAVAAESQAQTTAGDQNQRTAVPGVRGEVIVALYIRETQTPCKVGAQRRLAADFAGEAATVAPAHGMIGAVFTDLESGLFFGVPTQECLRVALLLRV